MFAVSRGGDAAQEIRVATEDGFGGFPDRAAVLVKSKFVEDKIATETTGGAGIRGENLDATHDIPAADAEFHAQFRAIYQRSGILLFKGRFEQTAYRSALFKELRAVIARVREHGDKATGAGEESIHSPGGERVRFADLPRPMQHQNARGAIFKDGALVAAQGNERGVFGGGGGRGWCDGLLRI